MGIFDFILKNPGVDARQKRLDAERDLAERKFAAQQANTENTNKEEALNRLEKSLDNPNLSEQGRQHIGKLIQAQRFPGFEKQFGPEARQAQADASVEPLKASLFSGLRSGEIDLRDVPETLQGADRDLQSFVDKPVSMFDFAGNKPTIQGEFREGTTTSTDPKTGKVTVLQQPLAPPSAREEAFSRLSPEEQANAVMKQGTSTTNVNVSTGKTSEEITKTVRSKVQNDIIRLDEQINQIEDLGVSFEDSFLTLPGTLRAGASSKAEKYLGVPPAITEGILEKLGIVDKADKDFLTRRSNFLLPAYTILNERIKEITGAAVREGEEGRLGQSTVDPTKDSPTQFRAKRAIVEKILKRQRKEKLILLARGLEYNAKNVNAIPIDNVDSMFKEVVLNEKLPVAQKLQSQMNVVKKSNEDGTANVSNVPSTKSPPKTEEEMIQFDKTFGDIPNRIIRPLMLSHPMMFKRIQEFIDADKMNISDIAPFLKKVKGMSDEEVIRATGGN